MLEKILITFTPELAALHSTDGSFRSQRSQDPSQSDNSQGIIDLEASIYYGSFLHKLAIKEICHSGNHDLVQYVFNYRETIHPSIFPLTNLSYLNSAIWCMDHLIRPLLGICNLDWDDQISLLRWTVEEHNFTELKMLWEIPRFKKRYKRKDRRHQLVDPLICAIERQCPTMIDLIKKENTWTQDQRNRLLLQVALQAGNIHAVRRIVELLTETTKVLNGTGISGATLNLLTHTTADSEHELSLLERLLEKGARMTYAHFGITALHVAPEDEEVHVSTLLLEETSAAEIAADLDF
ncbi:hypothetical protein EJ02DRAFT_420892 [Clathrospora elynae]|uniref:Ankyrin n=1 Tax=Clathrospora elynae TaxID=706981 RepID=A0A6A5STF4_9PLEO|nr:hypothetical protein EJ02DRAFT_420892 [Clathrospora elynae]